MGCCRESGRANLSLRAPVDNYFLSQGPPGPPGRQVRVDLGLVLCHLPLLPQLAPHYVPSFLLLAPTYPHCQLVSSLIPQPLRTPSALTSPLPLVEPFISLVISPTGGHGTWSQREGIRVCGWSEAVSTGRHPIVCRAGSASGVPVARVLFPQQACLCHRESLGTVDRRVLGDPRVTPAPLEPLGRG